MKSQRILLTDGQTVSKHSRLRRDRSLGVSEGFFALRHCEDSLNALHSKQSAATVDEPPTGRDLSKQQFTALHSPNRFIQADPTSTASADPSASSTNPASSSSSSSASASSSSSSSSGTTTAAIIQRSSFTPPNPTTVDAKSHQSSSQSYELVLRYPPSVPVFLESSLSSPTALSPSPPITAAVASHIQTIQEDVGPITDVNPPNCTPSASPSVTPVCTSHSADDENVESLLTHSEVILTKDSQQASPTDDHLMLPLVPHRYYQHSHAHRNGHATTHVQYIPYSHAVLSQHRRLGVFGRLWKRRNRYLRNRGYGWKWKKYSKTSRDDGAETERGGTWERDDFEQLGESDVLSQIPYLFSSSSRSIGIGESEPFSSPHSFTMESNSLFAQTGISSAEHSAKHSSESENVPKDSSAQMFKKPSLDSAIALHLKESTVESDSNAQQNANFISFVHSLNESLKQEKDDSSNQSAPAKSDETEFSVEAPERKMYLDRKNIGVRIRNLMMFNRHETRGKESLSASLSLSAFEGDDFLSDSKNTADYDGVALLLGRKQQPQLNVQGTPLSGTPSFSSSADQTHNSMFSVQPFRALTLAQLSDLSGCFSDDELVATNKKRNKLKDSFRKMKKTRMKRIPIAKNKHVVEKQENEVEIKNSDPTSKKIEKGEEVVEDASASKQHIGEAMKVEEKSGVESQANEQSQNENELQKDV